MLTHKDQVTQTFLQFKNMVERQTGEKLKILRTDNGKEYVKQKLKKILDDCGIIHQQTIRYTPQQNSLAERMNRTIVEKARTLLFDAGLNKEYWAEAVSTSTYLINGSPTKRLYRMTPYEVWCMIENQIYHIYAYLDVKPWPRSQRSSGKNGIQNHINYYLWATAKELKDTN